MKPYPKYKPSGVEWLGDVPAHWDALPIKRLSPVKRGASPRPIDNPQYFDEQGEFAWVRIADVSASERYLEITTQRLSALGSELSVKRYPNDFFLSIAGTVGKPIITKIKCCIHDGFVYFPKLTINPEYLYYIFVTGQPYLGLGKLGTQLNLNTDTVGYITIPLPPSEELDKIVKFLDEKTKQIDTLIEKKQKLIELLKEERQAVINEAVTKGINPKAKMKPSGVEWLGNIPEHWEVKKLKYVANSVQTGNTPPSDRTDFYENGNVDWFTPSDFSDSLELSNSNRKITRTAIESNVAKLFPAYSILLVGIGATLGKLGIITSEASSNQQINAITFGDNIFSYFGLLYLNAISQMIISFSNASTLAILNQAQTKDIPMIVPPLSEQQAIAFFLDKKTKEIDKLCTRAERVIGLLKEYRTALITEVVTGKVCVL